MKTKSATPIAPVIDAYQVDGNELTVRGRPLLDAVASLAYAELVIFALTGKSPSKPLVDAAVKAGQEAARRLYPVSPATEAEARSSEALIARACRIILSRWAGANAAPASPWPEIFSDDEWHGYVLFHAIAMSIGAKPYAPEGRFAARRYSRELLEAFSNAKRGPSPDKLMGALIGGFGVVAPTTALARFSASTRAPLEWGVVASAMGCGPAHLGACSLAMKRLEEAGFRDRSQEEVIAAYCRTKPFPGFGHPVMPSDPRVEFLFKAFDELPLARKARGVARAITKTYGIHPNIDFAAGTLFHCYGIPAESGSLFFWFCRLPIVIAHVCAKRRAPAFGLRSFEARAKYRKIPKVWL